MPELVLYDNCWRSNSSVPMRAQARLTWTNERWTDLFVVLVAEVPLVGEVGVM